MSSAVVTDTETNEVESTSIVKVKKPFCHKMGSVERAQ